MAISQELTTRIRGCVLGTVLGDAIGGPFEFGPLERVPALAGGDWIDGLYPYPAEMGAPHGVWKPPGAAYAPAGTGTDDTRLNVLLLDLAGAIAGALSGAEAFPSEMLDHVVAANKQVYSVDLEALIERLLETFYH